MRYLLFLCIVILNITVAEAATPTAFIKISKRNYYEQAAVQSRISTATARMYIFPEDDKTIKKQPDSEDDISINYCISIYKMWPAQAFHRFANVSEHPPQYLLHLFPKHYFW